VSFLWSQLRQAISLIDHGNAYIWSLVWVTIRVALISTAAAVVIGLPIGATIGLGRFRGRRLLQILANCSLALPPVVLGVGVLLFILPSGIFGGLRIEFTLTAVYVVQTLLALPFIVALTPAAVQGLPPGLVDQARALGARGWRLGLFALQEAKLGVMAAVIAAMGATMSEVGAVIIVGGNFEGHDETLASALLANFTSQATDPTETAIALLLLAMILLLLGILTVVQQRTRGIRLRFTGG
jgi:tungstate transport system permease protein